MCRSPRCVLATLLLVLAWAPCALCGESQKPLPLPEIVVAKAPKPPVIDGKIEPGEWDFATAATGFHGHIGHWEGLAHNQTVFFVTYDDTHLYVCMKNWRAPDHNILRKGAREQDDVRIVFDDSNEIWFSPPGAQPATYQSLFNSYPAVFDVKFIPSIGHTGKGWSGRWEMAGSESKEYWIVEARAPIKAFGYDRMADGSTWRALFTTDILFKKDGGFRRWGPWVTGWFKDIAGHPYLHFRDNSPIVQVLDVESVFTGKPEFPMAITGPAKGKSKVTLKARFGPAQEPAEGDLILSKTVEVSDGQRQEFTLAGDLAALKLPKEGDAPRGLCEITAASDDGTKLYSQVFSFAVDGYRRSPPQVLLESPYETPFGVNAIHAPLSKKLVVTVDRFYTKSREQVAGGEARLLEKETGKQIAKARLMPFRHDYALAMLDVSALKLPVETEKDWAEKAKVGEANKLIAETNKDLKAKGLAEIPARAEPGPFPAEFLLETVLLDKDDKEIAKTATPVKMMDYEFEWLGHDLGISDKVIPPWTPVRWDGQRLSMWNKTYRLNGLGLAEEITNGGTAQLSARMKLVVTADGKETELAGAAPAVMKLADAYAEMKGKAVWGDLEVQVESRAEFDGYVRNRMSLTPKKPVKLDKLSLVVTMPAKLCTHFCSTAGDMSAAFGETPKHWSSRETASGTRFGSFVPYVLLTDSEHGFSWCADNDKDWVIDPEGDAATVDVQGDAAVLRVNFIQRTAVLDKPLSIEYAWTVTPQKPRPGNWRVGSVHYWHMYPQHRTVMYADFDRRVVWDYYASPYPKDMEKSRKEIISWPKVRPGVTYCVGHTGDALGWFQDYKGRDFSALSADWSVVPGSAGSGEITRARGPNDYEIWHWDRWIRLGGLEGIYFDINYLGEEWNYLGGTAYILPDGRIQPGYSFMGQREYQKRLRYIFYENGKSPPNIWLHSTAAQPVFSWLADYLMEGENVQASGYDNDFMDAYPAARIRAISMGENVGAVPVYVCGISAKEDTVRGFLGYQFIGWTAVHDTNEGSFLWQQLIAESELWRDDVRFLPYWKTGLGVESKTPGIIVSAHARPGHALLWIVNTSHEDKQAAVQLDWQKLGLKADKTIVFDAETGERITVPGGRLTVSVPKRLWRAVRLFEVKSLKGDQTFVADFNGGEAAANEAFGYRYNLGWTVRRAFARGKSGMGLYLDEACSLWPRHNLRRDSGSIEWNLQLNGATDGTLLAFSVGNPAPEDALRELNVLLRNGKVVLQGQVAEKTDDPKQPVRIVAKDLTTADLPAAAPDQWRAAKVSWQGKEFHMALDGREILVAQMPGLMPIPPWEHGLETTRKVPQAWEIRSPTMAFGPVKGAVMDDLIMRRK